MIRNLGNKLGLAWWAKIETENPFTIYWYGPFLTKSGLNASLKDFLNDLTIEGSINIKHNVVRCKKEEPLTIY